MLEKVYLIITEEFYRGFLEIPGFCSFLEDCRQNDLDCQVVCEKKMNKASDNTAGIVSDEISGIISDQTGEDGMPVLIMTDSQRTADYWRARKKYVIGLQLNASSVYFEGVDTVLSSFEGIDASFLKDNYLRFRGLPVTICRTERLVIRESRPEDFEELFDMIMTCGNCFCTEEMGTDPLEEREKFLSYIHYVYPFFGFGLWTVTRRDGSIIGRCGLCPVCGEDEEAYRVELGYVIKKSEQRKGYGYEACSAILNYARLDLKLDMLYACIYKKNQASRHLAEKLGFEITSYPAADSQYQTYQQSLI
ncbi:MAG: GNAT family N-acetyltransferase [Lachnospiraceae bacterium]|nr:GNAT family N-acetyltransferase [Lachnospiraceae bacterium]